MGGYIGATAVGLTTTAADVQGDITSTDTTPELILKNTSEEDTEGGREGKITFKGEQSGGEESTLAQIESAHDGTSDDQKGDLIFKTNDGSDGASPTERMRIDSAGEITLTGNISNTSGDFTLDVDGDIILDANGAQLRFKDDGTEIGVISNSSNDLQIVSSVSDADMIFRGNDGGTPFNALTLDMSASGDATFNGSLTFGDGHFIGNGGGDNLEIISSSAENIVMKSAGGIFSFNDNSGTEYARFQDTGRLLIGKTSGSRTSAGCELNQSGFTRFTAASDKALELVRTGSDGEIVEFFNDSTHMGTMGCSSTNLYVGSPNNALVAFGTNRVFPANNSGAARDNAIDLGNTNARFDDVFATNGTIQTSDENEKQNIASLTSAEITAATAISKLFKTFKWKDKVAAKGDDARTHTGVVAQQVETAMSDAGLDASKYAFWCSDTWWQVDGGETFNTQEEAPEGATERNRKGIRYPELLSFIGAATEQRLTSIEARLDALEG